MLTLKINLNNTYEWCQEKDLYSNLNKCPTITFFKLVREGGVIQFNYSLENNNLLKVTTVHDLEVKYYSKLYFNDHLNFIRNNANSKRHFTCLKLIHLYKI